MANPKPMNDGLFSASKSMNVQRTNFWLDSKEFIWSTRISIFPSILPFLLNKRFHEWIKICVRDLVKATGSSCSGCFSSPVRLFISFYFPMTGDPTKLNGFVRMVVYILNRFVKLSQGDVVAVLGLHTLKNRLGITKYNEFSICFWWHFNMRKSAHNSFGFSSKNTWVITDAIRESTQSNALRRGLRGVIQLISKTAKGCYFILSRAISIIMEIVLKAPIY